MPDFDAGTDAGLRGVDHRSTDAGSRGTNARGLEDRTGDQKSSPAETSSIEQPVTENVWAFRIGAFEKDPSSGWNRAMKIDGLDDLLTKLSDANLESKVAKLAFVAHGNLGGTVLIEKGTPKDRELNENNVKEFSVKLAALAKFLTPEGKFMFMSCEAGAGREGSLLLAQISSLLPGRTVVGFTIRGSIRIPGRAGDMFESGHGLEGMNPALFKDEPRMTEESQYAKWARNGHVVQLPRTEADSALNGWWDVVRADQDGKLASDLEGAVANITTTKFELTKGAKSILSGTPAVDASKTLKTIDIKFMTGKNAKKTSLGIFQFGNTDFDSVDICLAEPSGKRPEDFTSSVKNRSTLLKLKRNETIARVGKWQVLIAEKRGGKHDPDLEEAVAEITNDSIRVATKRKQIWSATYLLDATATPTTIDITFTAGEDKGKTLLGILRFTGLNLDFMRIDLGGVSGKERPTDFESPIAKAALRLSLKRQPAR